MHNNLTFWERLKLKRRITVMDDRTLNELWHFQLSALGLTTVLVVMFLLTVAILSVVIIYTPIRNVLPGYNQNLRQQLMEQSERLDSLNRTVDLQRKYLDVIRDITAGEVKSDTVQPLDSLQLIFQEQLLAAKQEATEEFVEQYESKGKDNLQLFDVQNTALVTTIFRPAHGVIISPYAPREERYGVTIQTPEKENITAVLAGTVVWVNYEIDNTYTIGVQHANYLSVYRGIGTATKQQNAIVQAGETLGLMGGNTMLLFELWKDGYSINPEEIIAF